MAQKSSRKVLRRISVSLVVLAALWFTGIYFLKSEVERRFAIVIENEALRGRVWDCENMRVKGWGAELAIECDSMILATNADVFSSKTASIKAKIYNPFVISASLQGPFQWQNDNEYMTISAKSARINATIKEKILSEGDLLLNEARLDNASPLLIDGLPKSFQSIQIALLPSQNATIDGVNYAISLKEADWPIINKYIKRQGKVNLESVISVNQVGALRQRLTLPELEAWRQRGGDAGLQAKLQLQNRELIALDGRFNLDDERRIEGDLKVVTQGINILQLFLKPSDVPSEEVTDSVKERQIRVKFQEGRIKVGVLTIPGVILPPLF